MTASGTSLLRPVVAGAPTDLAGGHATSLSNEKQQYEMLDGRAIPWFEPAASVVNAQRSKGMAPSVLASVASLLEGGWWTQASLFAAGLADDPFCRLCHTAVGDLPHRMFWCPHRKNVMESKCPQTLEDQAAKEPENPLFTVGVPIRPRCPCPPPACEAWIGTPPRDGAAVRGVAYTDGALRGTVPKARRGGWAFVVNDGDAPMWGKFGTCSEAYATVLRTELRALSEILRTTVGPVTIYVDNSQVVDGVANGRKWCCHPRRDGSDIWRTIWSRLDELEGLVTVRKVKAHLSYQKVLEGRISWKDWVGNGVADLWAKRGCAESERLSPSSWVHSEWAKACALYRWALLVASEWTKDTEVSTPEQPKRSAATASRGPRPVRPPHTARPHELWRNSKHGWCRLCGIEAPWSRDKPPAAFGRPCLGSMGLRCGIVGREHAISPHPHSYDEGRVSLATLRANGAEKVMHAVQPHDRSAPHDGVGHANAQDAPPGSRAASAATVPASLLGGHASGVPAAVDGHGTLAEDAFEEEDPFGHSRWSMDQDIRGGAPPPQALGPSAVRSAVPEGPPGRGAHGSHVLRRCADLVWCQHCGRHAASRLGTGLINACRGVATGGYPSRIVRMMSGRHPITGRPLL